MSGGSPCPRCGGRTVWVCVGDSAPSCAVDCHLRVDAPVIAGVASGPRIAVAGSATNLNPCGPRRDPAVRLVIPMSSGVSITPFTRARVTSTVGVGCFPDRPIIGGAPSHWVVHEISVDGLVVSATDITGDDLASIAMVTADFFGGAVALPGADVVMEISYVGPDPAGATFVCGILSSGIE